MIQAISSLSSVIIWVIVVKTAVCGNLDKLSRLKRDVNAHVCTHLMNPL